MNTNRIAVIISIIFCFLLLITYLNSLESVEFFPDESQWISTSKYFDLFISGDFTAPEWDINYWTMTQPPLARYFIGIGRFIGGYRLTTLNSPWDFSITFNQNKLAGNYPDKAVLYWARIPMALMGVFACSAVAILVKGASGIFTGCIWVIFCLINPFLKLILRRAMGDSLLVAFTVCVMVFSILFVKQILLHKKQHIWEYIFLTLMGVSGGFAQASKLNGSISLIGAGFLAISTAIHLNRQKTPAFRPLLIYIILLVFSSQLVFIMINPTLWEAPVSRTIWMFLHRFQEMQVQAQAMPQYVMNGIVDRFVTVTYRVFENYSPISFGGALWINIPLFLIGLTGCSIETLNYIRGEKTSPLHISLLLIGVVAAIPSLLTPLDWDRYFILPVFFFSAVICLGLTRVIKFLGQSIKLK